MGAKNYWVDIKQRLWLDIMKRERVKNYGIDIKKILYETVGGSTEVYVYWEES